MIKSFTKFINEELRFDDYITFLTEADFSLPQLTQQASKPKPKVSWGTIKKGFDAVRDPVARAAAAKEGKKARKAAPRGSFRSLLGSQGSNPKLAKEGENVPEYSTKGLSLSPAESSGRVNTCACSTEECRRTCLYRQGRGQMSSIEKRRRERTDFMADNPHQFMAMLHGEIRSHAKSAAKQRKRAAVRLNVFSDIPHEHLHPEIFSEHPNVQFYDYTKVAGRVLHPDGTPRKLPPNYHLTLSSTGIHPEGNWHQARQHLNNGGVVAMVFGARAAKGKRPADPLPKRVTCAETGRSYRVIDGDVHDHRHLDHAYSDAQPGEGLIAGLRFKGSKKSRESAGKFVVHHEPGQEEIVVPHHAPQSGSSTPQKPKSN